MANERVVEVPWALMQVPHMGTILDIGSCSATYLRSLVQPGRTIHCLDPQDCHDEMPEGVMFHHQDLIGNTLPAGYFDTVLIVSTIEHIGFPHYGQTPFPRGDFLALAEVRRLLKPTGTVIVTMPAGMSKIGSWYRQYSPSDIDHLFSGWQTEVTFWGHHEGSYKPISRESVESYDYGYWGAGAVAGIVARPLR